MNKNQNTTFDDFFYDTWDYVSEKVIDDDFWNDNQDLIREMTFELYRFKRQSGFNITPKHCGKILESQFHLIFKNGIKIKK